MTALEAACGIASVATAGALAHAAAGRTPGLGAAGLDARWAALGALVMVCALYLLGGPDVRPGSGPLAGFLGAAAAIDGRTRRIPNLVALATLGAALIVAAGPHWPVAAAGALAVGGSALLAWRLGGMGMGDVKLLGAVGLALGPVLGLLAFASAAAAAGLVQGVVRTVAGGRSDRRFAFAPYIAVAVLACLVGPHLIAGALALRPL